MALFQPDPQEASHTNRAVKVGSGKAVRRDGRLTTATRPATETGTYSRAAGAGPTSGSRLLFSCRRSCPCHMLVRRAPKAAAAAIRARSGGIPFGPRRARTCSRDRLPPTNTHTNHKHYVRASARVKGNRRRRER